MEGVPLPEVNASLHVDEELARTIVACEVLDAWKLKPFCVAPVTFAVADQLSWPASTRADQIRRLAVFGSSPALLTVLDSLWSESDQFVRLAAAQVYRIATDRTGGCFEGGARVIDVVIVEELGKPLVDG
jgi:hypothetical protein